jgi:hypothetical protein
MSQTTGDLPRTSWHDILNSVTAATDEYTDTDLARLTVAALLRFPVPEPPSPSAF